MVCASQLEGTTQGENRYFSISYQVLSSFGRFWPRRRSCLVITDKHMRVEGMEHHVIEGFGVGPTVDFKFHLILCKYRQASRQFFKWMLQKYIPQYVKTVKTHQNWDESE